MSTGFSLNTPRISAEVRTISQERVAEALHREIVESSKRLAPKIKMGQKFSPDSTTLEDLTKESGDYVTNIR